MSYASQTIARHGGVTNIAGSAAEAAALLRAINEGIGITDDTIVFSITPGVFPNTDLMNRSSGSGEGAGEGAEEEEKDGVWVDEGNPFVKEGDVVPVRPRCVDQAMWEVGGAGVALRLVQLAQVRSILLRISLFFTTPKCWLADSLFRGALQTPHELSRTLGILTDGLKFSWQNSEDMERIRES